MGTNILTQSTTETIPGSASYNSMHTFMIVKLGTTSWPQFQWQGDGSSFGIMTRASFMLMTDGGKHGITRIAMPCLIGRVRAHPSWSQITSPQTLDGYGILSTDEMLRLRSDLEKIVMVISPAKRCVNRLHWLVRQFTKSGLTLIMSSSMIMPPCTANMLTVHSLPTICPSSLWDHVVVQNQTSWSRQTNEMQVVILFMIRMGVLSRIRSR